MNSTSTPTTNNSEEFNDLVDYIVDDDVSIDDETREKRQLLAKRTFSQGYFGTSSPRNMTTLNDFEADEDKSLLRWVNTQLDKAKSKRRITNFTYDLSVKGIRHETHIPFRTFSLFLFPHIHFILLGLVGLFDTSKLFLTRNLPIGRQIQGDSCQGLSSY